MKKQEKERLEEKTVVATESVVQRLHQSAAVGKPATEEDLAELRQAVAAEQPEFIAWLQTIGGKQVERNRNLCLLVRLGFEPYEMINLLGVGATNLCNTRRRLLKRLFGMEGTPKAFDRRILSMTKAPSNLPRRGKA